jgi:nitrile hydratase subunit beta
MTRPSAYRSHADLGGRPGHGRVVPEPEGELWHAPWEPRVLALTLAMGATGQWNIDMSRAARETLPDYTELGYYAIWLHALERLLLERGLVRADELHAGRAAHAARPLARTFRAANVPTVLARGTPTARSGPASPRFAVGDRVRTWAGEVPHHTRLPRYARGRLGTVVAAHGLHVFADAHASGRGEMPCHLYTVRFDGRELWGAGAEAGHEVSIDAWEPYLSDAQPGVPA